MVISQIVDEAQQIAHRNDAYLPLQIDYSTLALIQTLVENGEPYPTLHVERIIGRMREADARLASQRAA